MDRRAVLTPVSESGVVELASNVFRKQVIKHGQYSYKDKLGTRTLNFDPAYTANLVSAWRDRAFDAVPLQFADSDNRHTNDVERTRGEIIDFEPSKDGSGLDAIVRADPAAAKVLERYKSLPVSVRIIEQHERADGKTYPAAIQHVLATWDPRLTGMKPWERVELSEGDEGIDVLDLTEQTAPQGADQEGAIVPEKTEESTQGLSPDVLNKLTKFAGLLNNEGMFDVDDEDEDDELAEIARAAFEDEGVEPTAPEQPAQQPAEVAAAREPSAAEIEMARRLDLAEIEMSRLRTDASEKRYEALQTELAEAGIPPVCLDMCKSWLVGGNAIELSNGERRDPGEDIVKMLRELAQQPGMVDMSSPEPFFPSQGKDETDPVEAQIAWARQFAKDNGLNNS
jgi:hypothetical protein